MTEYPRIPTGQPQLDEILRGGFPAHSINIIMGSPGTGKTVLAEEMVFANAVGERPVVYLTTLSEPLSKVVSYLQRFTFYDEARMLESVVYEDLGPGILEHGIEFLLDRVRRLIRELGPKLLVIDSFKAIHDLAASPLEMRRLVAELAGILAAYDTTAFLVGEYGISQVEDYPEFAVADGVLQLVRASADKRDERYLRVLKLRGSAYQEGMHAFTISSDGLKVYPRLVTPEVARDDGATIERVESGVTGLDRLLRGGLWRGTSTLVMGPAGSGKTTVGLAFVLEGVRQGEPSLYLNFQENPSQLARSIRSLGIDLEEWLERGLRLQYASPVELQIDALVLDLFRAVEDGVRRVVIDSLGDLQLSASSRERFHDYLYSIVQHLASRDVTSVMTLETRGGTDTIEPGLATRFSSMADAMITLNIDALADRPHRTLRVVKARGTAHTLRPAELVIEQRGVRVLEEGDDGA